MQGLTTYAAPEIMSTSHDTLLRDLLELVAALDRRVPRLEREGEHDITRDARGLRSAALKRIAELERSLGAPPIGVIRRDGAREKRTRSADSQRSEIS